MAKLTEQLDHVDVQGFTVVQVKYCEKSKATHCIYLKEHSVREGDKCKPKETTLFLLNIPPYCKEEHLRRMFCTFGKVLRVFLHDKPSCGPPHKDASKHFPTVKLQEGFKVAYIVFKRPDSIGKAKSIPYSKPLVISLDNPHKCTNTGMGKWCKNYEKERINEEDLQQEIDTYMAKYDARVEEEKQKAKDMEGVPDDEGWVTVTRHGKNKGVPWKESQEKKVTAREKKKRKDKELLNFYSFQIRETKREQIAELRQKFEEDKQRIALMKASRRFRPY
ncbi:ribosomal RNA-processing protein 7 homolog A-like isoform X2 [Mizuhopecten yessoensis]|uniref:ribosomal RNA-processing protein 7 homolog A-like isoform X2 n=1 Tax=Mizuhopecten yessoensis TaxID=6573 RepID=UPI000B45B55B|nr:ribosomal RNA-processing protein 7 homolog A-like isoform X2 [Mizuhopecten yessoensis]